MHKPAALVLLLAMATAGAARAQPAAGDADFYRGKTLNIVVGHETGTGFDFFARALARHIGRYLPGEPAVVAQNMIGAGGLKAVNWIYGLAPKDGTALLTVSPEAIFRPLFGDATAAFDPVKLTWIGNMDESVATCIVTERSRIGRVEDLFGRAAQFGAPGPGTAISQMTYSVANFLGARIKVVHGYVGTADLKLALMRGEIEGVCGASLSTLKTQWKDEVDSGRFRPILQFALKRSPDLPDVPGIYEFAKSAEARAVFDIAFGAHALGRPLVAAPDIPSDRTRTLRTAFMQTIQDADYLAEVGKLGLATTPSSGEDAAKLVARFFSYPRSIVDQANAGLHPKE